jgi:hypothetical protein
MGGLPGSTEPVDDTDDDIANREATSDAEMQRRNELLATLLTGNARRNA